MNPTMSIVGGLDFWDLVSRDCWRHYIREKRGKEWYDFDLTRGKPSNVCRTESLSRFDKNNHPYKRDV